MLEIIGGILFMGLVLTVFYAFIKYGIMSINFIIDLKYKSKYFKVKECFENFNNTGDFNFLKRT